jgi:hypothetical protein
LTQRLLDLLALGNVHRDAGEAHGPVRLALELHSTRDRDPTLTAVRMSHADIEVQFSGPARLERPAHGLDIAMLVLRVDHGVERLLERERALRRQPEQRAHAGIRLGGSALQIPNEGGHRSRIESEAQPLLALGQSGRRLATHPGELQMSADPCRELARRERLRQVIVGAGREPLDARLLTRPGRKENEGYRAERFLRPQGLEKRETVDSRHHDVGQQEIGPMARNGGQRLFPVSHRLDDVIRREQIVQVFPHIGVIVRDQNAGAGGCRESPVRGRGRNLFEGERRARAAGNPAQHLLNVGLARVSAGDERVRNLDAVARQMGGAERHSNSERRALPERARDLDAAAMQFRELVDQGEPDAGAFLCASLGAFDPVESLEEPRNLTFRDADPRIRHLQHELGPFAPQARGDGAFEGELEGIREQVQYDLLPHVSIEKHGLIDRLAIHLECDSGGFHRRAEVAREIASEHRSIDGFERGLQPAGLDAREVE